MTWKHWDAKEATWLVSAMGSANCSDPAQTDPTDTVGGDKVPALHTGQWLGKSVWALLPWEKANKHIGGIVFTQGPGGTWQVTWKDGENPVCTSRRFNPGGKTNCVNLMSQEVKEQEQYDMTKNEFCEK